jgi:hypothetical protein
MEEENVIWNNFYNCNFLWFSTDFELFKKLSQTELVQFCAHIG